MDTPEARKRTRRGRRSARNRPGRVVLYCPGLTEPCGKTIKVFGPDTTMRPQPGGSTLATYLEPLPPSAEAEAEKVRVMAETMLEAKRKVDGAKTPLERALGPAILSIARAQAWGRGWAVNGLGDVRLGCKCGFTRVVPAMDLHRKVWNAEAEGLRRVSA